MGTYRVTGPFRVFGHEPGSTFERELPPEREKYLISVGHISKSRVKEPDAVDKTPSRED